MQRTLLQYAMDKIYFVALQKRTEASSSSSLRTRYVHEGKVSLPNPAETAAQFGSLVLKHRYPDGDRFLSSISCLLFLLVRFRGRRFQSCGRKLLAIFGEVFVKLFEYPVALFHVWVFCQVVSVFLLKFRPRCL